MMSEDVERYDLGQALGKGAYGTVKRAADKREREEHADRKSVV